MSSSETLQFLRSDTAGLFEFFFCASRSLVLTFLSFFSCNADKDSELNSLTASDLDLWSSPSTQPRMDLRAWLPCRRRLSPRFSAVLLFLRTTVRLPSSPLLIETLLIVSLLFFQPKFTKFRSDPTESVSRFLFLLLHPSFSTRS